MTGETIDVSDDDAYRSGASAYDRIIAAWLSGELPRNRPFTEKDLAAALNIGRPLVREALTQLEHEGLIGRRLGDSFVVAELDQGATVDLYEVREVLEGMAAALAAKHATQEEVEALRMMFEQHRNASVNADHVGVHKRLNAVFHRQICRMSRNRFLTRSLDGLRTALALGATLRAPGRLETAIAEHEALVDAIARHDEAGADAIARHHVRTALIARLEQGF